MSAGLGTLQDELKALLILFCCSQHPGWLQQVGGLWEKHDKSVGRGINGSCAFSAELCACFLLPVRKSGEKFLLKFQAQGFLRDNYSDKREKST